MRMIRTRMAALHNALWTYDRTYRLAWQVWPGSMALLISGWICFGTTDTPPPASGPWGKPATSAKVRSAGSMPDLSIWPEPQRDDVRSCIAGTENWSAKVEACSRLIDSGALNTWQMILIHNQRGMHLAATQPDRALLDYAAALKLKPSSPEIYANRASLHITHGRSEAAIADLDQAIKLWPSELAAKARVLRARAYYLLGDYDKATVDLDAAQKVDPGDPDAFLIRGSVDYDQKRYADAARDFAEFSRRNPHDPGGHFGRGMALEADLRFDEALLAYEAAIKLDPTDNRAVTARDRVKRRACELIKCLNPAPDGSGWWNTVGRP